MAFNYLVIVIILLQVKSSIIRLLQDDQIDKDIEKICKNIDCENSTTCHYCELSGCCQFNLQDGLCLKRTQRLFNNTLIQELKQNVEIKNVSTYPNPQMNVTYPICNIFEEVPLHNATNFLYKNHDICGIPEYCPNLPYFQQNEVRINFKQLKSIVKKGELCTIYFEGKMGPDFLIQISAGNISGINAALTFCLSVGLYEKIPCVDYVQQIKLQNTIFFKLRSNQFRMTLQFFEDGEIDFSQAYFYIISHSKLTQQYQQQLFQFVVILLLTILSSILIIAIFKALLVKIFGRRIAHWIDPEPLVPVRRKFNPKNEMARLKNKKLISIIKPEDIQFEQERCPFCLESFTIGVVMEIFCGHCFHENCLFTHFDTQKSIGKCSLCQIDITTSEQKKIQRQKEISISNRSTEKDVEMPIIEQQQDSSID